MVVNEEHTLEDVHRQSKPYVAFGKVDGVFPVRFDPLKQFDVRVLVGRCDLELKRLRLHRHRGWPAFLRLLRQLRKRHVRDKGEANARVDPQSQQADQAGRDAEVDELGMDVGRRDVKLSVYVDGEPAWSAYPRLRVRPAGWRGLEREHCVRHYVDVRRRER
jgi:hypothetical protein